MGWQPPAHTDYPWQDAPSTSTPIDTQHLGAMETGLVDYVQQVAGLLGIAPTTVKTAAYTAQAGDFVPVDATGSNVAIALPSAPADQTRIGVKLVITASSHTVTINAGGADVFNKTGGSTSVTLQLVNQGVVLQYASSAGIWYVTSDDLPLSGLDGRYATSASGVTSFNTRSGAVVPADGDYAGVVAAQPTGATAAFRLVGATTSGAPASGTFVTGDAVFAQDGHLWICTAGGTSGTWANAGASAGVSTFNARSGAVVPVSADYTAAQVTNAADKSSGSAQNFTSNLQAPAFVATGLTGATAASRYAGATTSGAPVSGTFLTGDFVIDQTARVWVCTAGGTPGTWVTPSSSITSGRVTTDVTNATTTMANVTGLAFTIGASQIWTFEIYLAGKTTNSGVGSVLQLTGPASPTLVLATLIGPAASSQIVTEAVTAFSSATSNIYCQNPGLAAAGVRIAGTIVNGANAGTVQLQFKASASGTVTAKAGSYLSARQVS